MQIYRFVMVFLEVVPEILHPIRNMPVDLTLPLAGLIKVSYTPLLAYVPAYFDLANAMMSP